MQSETTRPHSTRSTDPGACATPEYALSARLCGDLHSPGLPANDLRRLGALFRRRKSFAPGEFLYRAGDAFHSIYEIVSGCFKTCSGTPGGDSQVTGFHIAGDLVGFDGIAADRHTNEVVALDDSQVCAIAYAELMQLMNASPGLQRRFHAIISREIGRGQQMLLQLGSMYAEERVAAFLLDLLQRLQARGFSGSAVNLRMTRNEIGSYLGLTLETVSRTFARLHSLAILAVHNKDIRILDLEALRRFGGTRP